MKKFIIKSAIFIVICTSIALGIEYIYYRYSDWRKTIDGWEVYTAIRNSKTKQCKKKLMIGDSVGMQLFPCNENNDSVALCTCNQAVTMAGFYFLMKNYLETNEECLPEKVILLVTPLSLRNNVDEFTYHYFLKPFGSSEYHKEYSQTLKNQLCNVPSAWTATLPFIRISMYTKKYIPNENDFAISPIAIEYLQKMDNLSSKYGVQFVVRSVPVKCCLKEDIENRMHFCVYMPEFMRDYWKGLQYMDDTCYVDKVHFSDEVLQMIEKDYLLK